MFRVEGIEFSYDRVILKNINFEVKKGELVAILGKNGAGKSTLLKSIAKILKAKGRVFFDNLDLFSLPNREFVKKIGYVSQKQEINKLTVFEMLLLGRRSYFNFSPSKEDYKEVKRVIKELSLEEIKLKPISNLSGGELQKVAIARAIIQGSEVILLDEPTNNLDIKNQIEILKFLSSFKKSSILVLHDINLALRFCDRFIFLKDQKIAYEGDKSIITPKVIKDIYDIEVEICNFNSIPVIIPK